MKTLSHIIVFPIILGLSIMQALLANPFRFRIEKDGIDIGIVPILLIISILA